MKPRNPLLFAFALLMALAAAGAQGARLAPGKSSVAEVRAKMGKPTLERKLANGETVLWYSKLPNGREIWAARIDRSGTLVSLEQRLTSKYIGRLRADKSTADEVLDTIGPPYRKVKMPFKGRTAWEYQLRNGSELKTLYLELSPDNMVRAVYQLHDRDMQRPFP